MTDVLCFALFLVAMLMLMVIIIVGIAWLKYYGWQAVVIALPAIVVLVLFVALVLVSIFV